MDNNDAYKSTAIIDPGQVVIACMHGPTKPGYLCVPLPACPQAGLTSIQLNVQSYLATNLFQEC